MKFLPKNEHLEVAMKINATIGVWPVIKISNGKRSYIFYSNIIFIYFLIFVSKSYLQLYYVLTAEMMESKKIFENLATTLICTLTVMRVYAMRTKTMLSILNNILETEKRILIGGHTEEIVIYRKFAFQSRISNKIFVICLFIVTSLYFICPIFAKPKIEVNRHTNDTSVVRPLPLSSWFPYDEQKHYAVSYCWQLIDGCLAASFVTYTDCLIFSLIIFPLGQITLLNHKLRNFSEYVKEFTEKTKTVPEVSSRLVFRSCVIIHQNIIRYVYDFNTTFGFIMLLDFLQSSLQLASILIQLASMATTDPVNCLNSAQYAVSMLVRLLVYYWNANGIIYESSHISQSIYLSDWEDQPKNVKKMMLMMMKRSMIPLSLRMSSFGNMSLDTFVKILKGAYTYMMFVNRVKN